MEINASNLPIMETFYSIQGEGFHSGKPAYFIRLGGCDVGCHWCDVKESWDHGDHKIINVDKYKLIKIFLKLSTFFFLFRWLFNSLLRGFKLFPQLLLFSF